MDITKQSNYWQSNSQEDFIVAKELLGLNKIRHSLFFAHLAIEKILKAHVCKSTDQIAPKMHNLVRLAEIANLNLDENMLNVLADMNEFNIEGRYPIPYLPSISMQEAENYIKKSEEVLEWLNQKL